MAGGDGGPDIDVYVIENDDGAVAGFAATRGGELLHFGTAVETWGSGLAARVNIGAVPILVDIDPQTLAMDPQQARAARTPCTAAVLVVRPYCSVADLDAFTRLSAELGIPLIEDCAQAHGARWRGQPAGLP
jgi:L-glutamine:scyllo-inosose aminotransferase/L-glutamine:2-deoxy-scyllo-inosose/3-amino-2,3-dideoxy-scyllo-inosose aminotransferase